MRPVEAARLFACKSLLRLGVSSAGRALVRALGSEDEDLRAVAGAFLVQTPKEAAPLLREALPNRQTLPMVLTVLGDLGDPQVEPELREFVDDPDPKVAQAAREALRVLFLAQRPPSGTSR